MEKFLALGPSEMTRTRLTTARGQELNLPLPATGYGLSRRKLDAFLFDHAKSLGVDAHDGVDVRSIDTSEDGKKELTLRPSGSAEEFNVRASVVIIAHGRRSRLDRKLNRPFFQKRSPYVAFKRHFSVRTAGFDEELPSLEGLVELHTFRGGYCGVSFAEDNIVNVCTIFDQDLITLDRIDAEGVWSFLSQGRSPLARRLSTLEARDDDSLAIAQIPLTLKERSSQNILFVGDAAGMIAPLAGDGQAMAMESALMLANLLHEELPTIPFQRWNELWQKKYANRLRLGQWLQRAMIRPQIAVPSVHVLNALPSVGRALIGLTRSASRRPLSKMPASRTDQCSAGQPTNV